MLKHICFVSEKKLKRAVVFAVAGWQLCPRQGCISLEEFFPLSFFHVLFRHCCFFNHRINQIKEITWSYQKWKEKMQGDFSSGCSPSSSSMYNPNFILCFLSKSSLLKSHLDKGIWFRKGVWHLVRHLTPCHIITEKLSEIHSGSSALIVLQLVVHPLGQCFSYFW